MSTSLRLLLSVLMACFALQGVASADTLVYQPNDSDLEDLDHHYVYTWRITNIATSIPEGHRIESAYLLFDNISNWDNGANRLFMHLLDTSLTPAGQKLTGSTWSAGNTSVLGDEAKHYAYRARDAADSITGNIKDHFAVVPNGVYPGNEGPTGVDALDYFSTVINGGPSAANSLVTDGTENTPLGDAYGTTSAGRQEGWAQGVNGDLTHSFRTIAEDYQYDFTDAQILKLTDYIANGGDIALALDPDCHFFNEGVWFVISTGSAPQQVPEPASLALLGIAAAGMFARRRRMS